MRKITILCAYVALMFGCSPDNTDPVKEYVTIGFENAELLTHTGGLADYFDNILWGKPWAALIEDEENTMDGSLWYDDILYTEDIVGLGSFYTDFWGSFDMWSGFAISNTASMTNEGYPGYSGQFNVAATSATKFAVGYCAPSGGMRTGGDYEDPAIVLSKPVTFTSAEFANTTIEYLYPNNTELWYTVTATGYLNDVETGTVEIKLIENGIAKSGWETVSLTELGEVDKIIFTADSNDRNAIGVLCPAYFCMDNLKYEKPTE